MESRQTTEIWRKYRSGVDHHSRTGMYTAAGRCHRFYEGDQWHALESGGEELPAVNFIKPICKYKITTVAMNDTAVLYSAPGADERAQRLCAALSRLARAQWEKSRMDSKKWSVIKNACITGDHYAYCFDEREPGGSVARRLEPSLAVRLVHKTDVYLADEQESDLDAQEWIILAERVPVAAVRRAGRAAGLSAQQLALIVPDEPDETQPALTGADEVPGGEGKCTSLLYMQKTPAGLRFCRSVESVVYCPWQEVPGLRVYPLCAMRWEERHASARGIGAVEGLIPNQIEVNRTVARRAICTKRYSFPTTVYDQDRVLEPDKLGTVGASVAVQNLAGNPISGMVQYLSPVPIGPDAARLQSELISAARELEGASDAATGQIDPTKASGEAIKAARDQSALTLNEQSAAYRQFVEDLARIWYALWTAYAADGLLADGVYATQAELAALNARVRIDISPVDPYSVLAREMSLENALAAGRITFAEYVSALDDNTGAPRDKFEAILARRAQSAGSVAWPADPGAQGGGEADALSAVPH